MRRKLLAAVVGGLALLIPSVASAQFSSGFPLVLVPDGTEHRFSVTNGTTIYVLVETETGNSYSLRVMGDYSTSWLLGAGDLTLNSGSTNATVVHNETTDPQLFATSASNDTGDRISFRGDGSSWEMFEFTNSTGSTKNVIVSAIETTLFSASWTTNGTYNTYYSFRNTTNSTCNLILTLYDTAGAIQSSATLAVTSGATGATNTVALGTPRDKSGTARASHDCPPGAFLVEADNANFTLSPPYIQPIQFKAVRH